ncbi:unnamed protein product [Dovyalis caffra]|uniref:Uncharacterized protein n=1 Tax=Dovyalis caffra TaxID=77055 RepID=A0AAV1RVG5_9ROSI|nr:unnamed protein product [Dovyalis caffra]
MAGACTGLGAWAGGVMFVAGGAVCERGGGNRRVLAGVCREGRWYGCFWRGEMPELLMEKNLTTTAVVVRIVQLIQLRLGNSNSVQEARNNPKFLILALTTLLLVPMEISASGATQTDHAKS